MKFLVSWKLPPTPPMEEEEKVTASETGMTKLGASKRKRTSSGDAERGKLVLEVVEPAVEEPEEKASSHESEPYIPIKPYRCPGKCALALYSLYSHIQALFIPLKPSFF